MSQSASFWGALFTVVLPCCGPASTRLPALPGCLRGLSTQRYLGQAALTVRSGRRSRKGLLEDAALRQCDWCPRQREQCGHRCRGWNSPTFLLHTKQLRERGCWEGGGLLRPSKPLSFPPGAPQAREGYLQGCVGLDSYVGFCVEVELEWGRVGGSESPGGQCREELMTE